MDSSGSKYTLVRDFAYEPSHKLHYGPPEDEAGTAESVRFEGGDMSWQQIKQQWEATDKTPVRTKTTKTTSDLPPISLRDGPPYAEDADLLSPVVTSSRKRRSRTGGSSLNAALYMDNDDIGRDRPDQFRRTASGRRSGGMGDYSEDEIMGDDDSQYSRDYQFSITSPDEEMHGKAVALFDFQRENENELPLAEGQVIWVSYRHGQGWLVAEDPKTHESGLVPEEYVRLLRDIDGGLSGLNSELVEAASSATTPDDTVPPTSLHSVAMSKSSSQASNGKAHQNPPIVSTFSTSSKDLDPYPKGLLDKKEGQVPPQVVHYQGSEQANQDTDLATPISRKDSKRSNTSSRRSSRHEIKSLSRKDSSRTPKTPS